MAFSTPEFRGGDPLRSFSEGREFPPALLQWRNYDRVKRLRLRLFQTPVQATDGEALRAHTAELRRLLIKEYADSEAIPFLAALYHLLSINGIQKEEATTLASNDADEGLMYSSDECGEEAEDAHTDAHTQAFIRATECYPEMESRDRSSMQVERPTFQHGSANTPEQNAALLSAFEQLAQGFPGVTEELDRETLAASDQRTLEVCASLDNPFAQRLLGYAQRSAASTPPQP